MTVRAEDVWKEVETLGKWQQEIGQKTELEVQKVTSDTHLWYKEDAYLLDPIGEAVIIKVGDIAGRDSEDDLVLIRNEEELRTYLQDNIDESEDETFIPGDEEEDEEED